MAGDREELLASQTQYFPAEWNELKRDTVADELNAIASSDDYRELTNDALRVLAGLPGNERAFTQITIKPLDPEERDPEDPDLLRWRDRVGPDTDPNYRPRAKLRAYVDTLDGRSTNRYFYRAAYVDGAHNRSLLSLSSPPVYLPNVVPPRAPVITRVLGGDRQITLKWASNREPDLAEYWVYRAESKEAARDLRLMTSVHTEAVPAGDPAARPAEVFWTDEGRPGLVSFYYRLVAVDNSGNVSEPSPPSSARAFDDSLPEPPELTVVWTNTMPSVARATWAATEETLLECRSTMIGIWSRVTDWLAPGVYTIDDPLNSSLDWDFRLRVRKTTGAIALGEPIRLAGNGG
jgi:hypothetical protein